MKNIFIFITEVSYKFLTPPTEIFYLFAFFFFCVCINLITYFLSFEFAQETSYSINCYMLISKPRSNLKHAILSIKSRLNPELLK